MAIVAYSKQNEYDLVNSNQDCMGWPVFDETGNQIGKVTEINIDTNADMVSGVIVDNARHIPASNFALQNGKVVVRGPLNNEESERAPTAVANQTAVVQNNDQTASQRNYDQTTNQTTNANHIASMTSEGNEGETVVPIIEEQLKIGKRTVESGTAHVRTNVTERPVEETINLREEHVTVERRPVDRAVGNAPNAFQEGTIEITETAEVPVVSKEARVVEEVVVGKDVTERQETIRDTVKRTEVEVNEVNRDNTINRQKG
jgi:uncharacterized protein (TIGR02271 family)